MIEAYLSFSLLAVLYCRVDVACDYVKKQYGMMSRYNEKTKDIEVYMDKGTWLPSPYKHINGFLLKKIKGVTVVK